MATFKVGQRVRILPTIGAPWEDQGTIMEAPAHLELGARWWAVLPDVHKSDYPTGEWYIRESELRPLTDPRADQFIADLNRFAAIAEKRPLGEKLADRLRFA